MTNRFVNPIIKYTTSTLKTMPGAELYFYITGTTTPKVIYQDFNGTVPHTNPVVALSDGHFPPIFLDGTYRVELKYLGVTQPGWPVDDIGATNDPAPLADWNSGFSYSVGDLVTGPDGNRYQSLQNNNLNNDPTAPGSLYWSQVFLGGNVDSWEQLDIAARSGPGPKADAESAIRYSLDLPEPTAVSFVRGNADGTYTNRTATQTKADLSLNNVNNTSDINKPLSNPQQTYIDNGLSLKADQTALTAGLATKLNSVVAGNRISVDNSNPLSPVVNYSPFASDAVQPMKTPASFFGRKTSYSAIVLLGDSNGEGVGAANYAEGYAGLFFRAVQNAIDTGLNTDRGFRYESILRMSVSGVYGFTSTGTLIGGGVCDSRISLANGQSLFVTGREVSTVDCFYEASLSAGALHFFLNGSTTPFKIVTITGTGTKDTFPSYPVASGYYIKESDTVEIRSVGGTVVVTELFAVRASMNGPLCYSIVRQGWGINEFNDPARVSEAAAHINRFSTSGDKLVIICLGTNNQSGVVGLQLSPTDYITALNNLITSYTSALTVGGSITKFAVWVPHQTQDPRPLGTYQQYIDAIVAYCNSSVDVQCIRLDQSAVGYNFAYLADNRHFNKFGHAVVARYLCDQFGIPQKFDIPSNIDIKFAPAVNTPSVVGSTTPGTQTYSLQYGVFKSRNGECMVNSIVTLSSKGGTAAGSVRITNSALPNAGLSQPQVLQISGYSGVTLPAGYTQVGAEIINATNTIALYKSGTAVAKADLNMTEISGTFSINISGFYLTQ